ncbi:serine/threonine protein kinase IRE like [Verticillium longisporum]|nr:serine/threonine protein kinase IRE like [Verticillium longisporum]
MDSKDASNMLAPPAVTSLRAQSAGVMERTFSEDIREEREELREAAEQTLNVIGTTATSVPGTSISDLILGDNKSVFLDVAEAMRSDDSRSQRVRFAVHAGPLSRLLSLDDLQDPQGSPEEPPAHAIELEAQGIMVYDVVSGGESHTMWMIRPWIAPREIQIDLPAVIVDSLGSGAEVLASYLTQLAESGVEDPENHPPPLPVLCRICERQISPWWFEKHTDLCLQEHRAEMDVQMAQENLTEHRHAIVKVLDALEARKSRSLTGEQPSLPLAEYKGLAIGPPPSSQSSPGTSVSQSRDRSGTGGFGHARARSFAIRRPQARIVELLVDLCDTAIEVSTPAIKESSSHAPGELRTQSPQSESRISQVMHWQSPSTNTLEQETGLALLCADTEKAAKAKVEAVFRHRKIIEVEFAVIVQDCIDEAMRKAARIASGRLSDSTEDEAEEEDQEITPAFEEPSFFQQDPTDNTSALAAALQQVSLGENADYTRPVSFVGSTRSSSPKECPTPKSNFGGLANKATARDSRRGSIMFESDTGDSDGSIRSSSLASRQAPRTDSPISEFGDLRRTSSPRRQESPSRATQPSSPLRINKPRNFVFGHDGIASPEASPMMPGSEFSSPAVAAIHHHRRQSSAAMSEFAMKPPPSPRLGAHNPPPQARPAPPSIKDFEIIKPISKGAFGSVYLSKKKSTGEYFAIKVLKKADMVAKNQVGNVKAERAILMWQGQSEFVAKLYWTFSSKDYLYLVMEYLNGGDCASLIKVLGGLPEDWAKKYLGEVILGVEHLHSRDIIHRDLKPDNLLIDQKGHLKLTDFGLSRMGLDTNRRFVGTPDYLAPETINGEKQDETSDWWSVGCIMFEFMYGFPPFHAGEAEHVFENILARKIQWPDETECEISDEAKDLINKLLCMEPSKRLGSNLEDKFQSGGEEIRSHPWFNGINWDTLVEDEAQFVPQTEDPEDTEYFDARGAVLQSFAEEMEDQTSPPSSTAGSDYPDRPHDALSRVRSQTRRLSEPVVADDFGSFAFKNLPVLEKANKDVIQKLRAEALASQNKPSTSPGENNFERQSQATIALWTERGQLVAQPSVSAILAALGVLCDWTTRGRTTQGIEYILRPLAAIDHFTSVQRGDRHPQGASKPAEGCHVFISITCEGSGPGASPIGIVPAKVDGNAETIELFIYWTIPLLDRWFSIAGGQSDHIRRALTSSQ